MAKVEGIGGIFFKCEDSNKIKRWYKEKLGLKTDEYGALFEFRTKEASHQKAYLQWSPFDKNTQYFKPSEKEFMINYRVSNIEELVKELRQKDVEILDEIEEFEYGKFVHILDPEGNKVELWEPKNEETSFGE